MADELPPYSKTEGWERSDNVMELDGNRFTEEFYIVRVNDWRHTAFGPVNFGYVDMGFGKSRWVALSAPSVETGERALAIYYVRAFGCVIALRSPANKPLYSERNRRGVKVIPLGFGWRITVRKIVVPQDTIETPKETL